MPRQVAVRLTRKAYLRSEGDGYPVLYHPGTDIWVDEDMVNESMILLDANMNPVDPDKVPVDPVLDLRREQEQKKRTQRSQNDMARMLGQPDGEAGASRKVDPARDAQIRVAAATLDKTDASLWTEDGVPKVQAVRNRLPFAVTRADIERIAPDVRRSG